MSILPAFYTISLIKGPGDIQKWIELAMDYAKQPGNGDTLRLLNAVKSLPEHLRFIQWPLFARVVTGVRFNTIVVSRNDRLWTVQSGFATRYTIRYFDAEYTVVQAVLDESPLARLIEYAVENRLFLPINERFLDSLATRSNGDIAYDNKRYEEKRVLLTEHW
jgi:hypothetical protein